MKKELVMLVMFVFLVGFVSFVTAEISVSQPKGVYNFGDRLDIVVDVNPVSSEGWFMIDLVCGENSENLEKIIAESFEVGEGHQRSIDIPLTPDYIGDLEESCNIVASLGDEKVSTENFLIIDEVVLVSSLNKQRYDPGETIVLSVEAIKANGYPLEGTLDVSGAVDLSGAIVDGKLVLDFSMPKTAEAGDYDLELLAYDSDEDGNVLNSVSDSVLFTINQIPSYIENSLSALEIEPGTEFSFSADLYDQSGKKMSGLISVYFISPNEERQDFSLDSGKIGSIVFETNSIPGVWRLVSEFVDVVEEKEFEVLRIQKAEFEFLDSILIIKNTGNDIYNKTIEIQIGGDSEFLHLNIGVGEERRFNLKAPDGEYKVVVSDGVESAENFLVLSGRAVSVNDLGGQGLFSKYPLLWVLILIVLGSIGIVLFYRYRRKSVRLGGKVGEFHSKVSKKVGSTMQFTNKSPESQSIDSVEKNLEEDMIDISGPGVKGAESSLVLRGQKSNSAVISVKISSDLNDNAKKELERILKNVKKEKGVIELKGDNIIIVFSPLVTKTFDNEHLAAKVGFEILQELEKYNKKFKDKIEFGIGVSSGDLVASIEENKLKYTSMGNTIAIVKKMADSAKRQMIVSEKVRNKLVRDLKVEKLGKIGSVQTYLVSKFIDNAGNKEKLKEILKRMDIV